MKKPMDVTWMLRRVLWVYHPGRKSVGTGSNPWWSVKMPTRLLTSALMKRLVEGMEEWSPSQFFPWYSMDLGGNLHSGPGFVSFFVGASL